MIVECVLLKNLMLPYISLTGKIRKIEGAGEISANLEVLELFPYLASSKLS